MGKWIDVKDRLPVEEGWYLVWAPGYTPTRHGREKVDDGYMFVKFRPNYKFPWTIECEYYPNLVKYWMPLPEKPLN